MDLTRSTTSIPLLLVDDDAFNREGVRLFLTREGYRIWEAGDEESAWQIATQHVIAAAVIDIAIPPTAAARARVQYSFGIRLARRLKQAYPAVGVVLFSAYEDRGSEVLEMLREGLRGLAYKLKGCPPQALLEAIQETSLGRVLLDPEVTNPRTIGDELRQRLSHEEQPWVEEVIAHFDQLSPREREVVYRLAASQNTDGIAEALQAAPRTIEHHISRAYEKLGLRELPPHLHRLVILTKACMIIDLQSGGR